MDIKLLSGALGAEVGGIDLKDTSLENFKKINKLLLEHKVIFFRNQNITAEEQLALAKHFGPLEKHVYVKGRDKYPEIIRIIKKDAVQANHMTGRKGIEDKQSASLDEVFVYNKITAFSGTRIFQPPKGGRKKEINQNKGHPRYTDLTPKQTQHQAGTNKRQPPHIQVVHCAEN